MTEIIDTPAPDRMQELLKKQPKFYRHRRIIHPLLISVGALVLKAHPFVVFLAYVISGLIWDWVVFTYDECKDSELLPEFCFEKIGVTGQQVDELNSFMVDVRRGAFAAGVATSAATIMFLAISYEMVFMLTYIFVTLSSMIIATRSGKIISLYRFDSNTKLVESAYPMSILPHSDHSILCQRYQLDPLGSTNSIAYGSDPSIDHSNPFDPNSSAAYSLGGILDPNRFNYFNDETINNPSIQSLEDYSNH